MGISPLVKAAELHPSPESASPRRPTLWGPGRSQRQEVQIATANFDTLRPLGRLAEVDLLLHNASIDFCGIQEGRWFDNASLTQDHYQFLLSKATKQGTGGVGLAIKHSLLPTLMAYRLIGPRLLWARFRGRARHLSVIVAYAPTNAETVEETERETFYTALQETYWSCPSMDVKVILGDMNVNSPSNPAVAPGCLGPWGPPQASTVAEETPNGSHFVEFLNHTGCCDLNTWFRKPPGRKATFYSPNEEHLPTTLDHILIDRRSRSCAEDLNVRQDLHLSTYTSPRLTDSKLPGHRLVLCKLRFRMRKPAPQKLPKEVGVCKYSKPALETKVAQDKILATLQSDPNLGNIEDAAQYVEDNHPELSYSSEIITKLASLATDTLLSTVENCAPIPPKENLAGAPRNRWISQPTLDLIQEKHAQIADWQLFVKEKGFVGPRLRLIMLQCAFETFKAERRYRLWKRQATHGTRQIPRKAIPYTFPAPRSIYIRKPAVADFRHRYTTYVPTHFRIGKRAVRNIGMVAHRFDWSHVPRAPEVPAFYQTLALHEANMARDVRTVKAACRKDKTKYWYQVSADLRLYQEQGNYRELYRLARKHLPAKFRPSAPVLLHPNGTRTVSPEDRLDCWTTHYTKLLNTPIQPKERPPDPIDSNDDWKHEEREVPPHWQIKPSDPIAGSHHLMAPISEEDTEAAFKAASKYKSPGGDQVTAEMLMATKAWSVPFFTYIYNCCLLDGEVPQNWKDAVIISLYKDKGDSASCANYRGISLLSVIGKGFSHILVQRLQKLLDHPTRPCLLDYQFGFRRGRGTLMACGILQRILESGEETDTGIYSLFIDLEKTVDQVPRNRLWRMMLEAGYPYDFVRLLRNMHHDTHGIVRDNGQYGKPFPISLGVRQGSKEGPLLFNIFIDIITRRALARMKKDPELGVKLSYRYDGQWVSQGLQPDYEHIIHCLMYADDVVLLATSEASLQKMYNIFEQELRYEGMKVSNDKTEAQVFRALPTDSVAAPLQPRIVPYQEDQPFPEATAFKYLGQRKQRMCSVKAEIQHRTASAQYIFNGLRKAVFGNKGLPMTLRIDLFKSMVLPRLLYAVRTAPVAQKNVRKLESFQNRCLRRIFHVPV